MCKKTLLVIVVFGFISCHSVKWNEANNAKNTNRAPKEILSVFEKYSGHNMILKAINPGYDYTYDVGEKDSLYGTKENSFRFTTVSITLLDKMPKDKVLANFKFIDDNNNTVKINHVDLLR